MTAAATLLSTAAGVALIGVVGRDAFDVLFNAEGRGTFSRQITRVVWRVCRRSGTRHGLFSIAGPLALVYGNKARKEIDSSGGRLGGRGMATAGIVMGWIGIGLWALWIIIFIVSASSGA